MGADVMEMAASAVMMMAIKEDFYFAVMMEAAVHPQMRVTVAAVVVAVVMLTVVMMKVVLVMAVMIVMNVVMVVMEMRINTVEKTLASHYHPAMTGMELK